MRIALVVGIVVVALAASAFAAHRTALWAEARGWIFYKKTTKFRGSSLGYLEEIYNPGMQHVMEERDSERGGGDQEASGGGPDPGAE